jgi:hypothetical protein
MKTLACVFALFASSVYAADYDVGQCPVAPNCAIGAGQAENATTYADSTTFYLGNWTETYGIYEYTSSLRVVVSGENTLTPCSGRGCHGARVTVTVTDADVDGVEMTHRTTKGPYGPIDHWTYTGSLAPGQHKVTVRGSVTGATWWGRWSGSVQGLTYTLMALPPSCGDSCD